MDNQNMLEMIAETKKDLFRAESIKKRICYSAKTRIEKIITDRYLNLIERIDNTHYSYVGHRIEFGNFIQNVKIEIYYVQNENLNPDKIKLIDGIKKDIKDKVYYFKTGNYNPPLLKTIQKSFTVETIFNNNFTM